MTTLARRAGRVLLVDSADRVLLFRGGDPTKPELGTWWFTPGGGLDEGESWADGAARELFEETGLQVPVGELGSCVHRETSEFHFAGTDFRQDSCFFLLRVDGHDVDTSGFEELEASSIVEHRWWAPAELAATNQLVYPRGLRALLVRLGI